MGRHVALLRAVNVGGRKLPMAELRALCGEIGWADVATYIASGNAVFTASGAREGLEAQLEAAISVRFEMDVPTIVRSAEEWRSYAPACPFPDAARDAPNRLLLLLSKRPPVPGADAAIQARAADGERVALAGDALWIHFPEGSGRSKLTPSLIDRLLGSPSTSRNHNTLVKLGEML
ncbi:MAG TPA: DUF1697 domain-containing protein [Allosphingosinicella sp.]|nr:DUF1697 domain-containing protein [Allosphingosinicella sp.]